MVKKEKIDLFRQLKSRDYLASGTPALVKTGEGRYLTVEGKGAPGGEDFNRKIGALYGVAYTIKMTRKYAGEQDYVVGKLEAQWWSDSKSEDFGNLPPEKWRWKLMIRTPGFVEQKELESAVSVLLEKKKDQAVKEIKLETIAEGQCVQMLHVGPYEEERKSVERMKAFAEEQGLKFSGLHHEIYISDPRRVPPKQLKTILRIPVSRL
ncbi:MAG: hypothetical protein DRP87_14985 [Spirochaetes bacterium]|nr:MAG: hypothetical protein DRP87_14985 [Spirochaetota bacterium]